MMSSRREACWACAEAANNSKAAARQGRIRIIANAPDTAGGIGGIRGPQRAFRHHIAPMPGFKTAPSAAMPCLVAKGGGRLLFQSLRASRREEDRKVSISLHQLSVDVFTQFL